MFLGRASCFPGLNFLSTLKSITMTLLRCGAKGARRMVGLESCLGPKMESDSLLQFCPALWLMMEICRVLFTEIWTCLQ
jgi:hypothetical protein